MLPKLRTLKVRSLIGGKPLPLTAVFAAKNHLSALSIGPFTQLMDEIVYHLTLEFYFLRISIMCEKTY